MPEFRIEGLSTSGKAIVGIIEADGFRLAKEKAQQMAVQRKFKVVNITPRTTFIYKVQRGTEKPILGEQKAFTKEEVEEALSKMGFRVIYVRKKLIDLKPKPPMSEIVTFVRVSADLIRQKLPYNEILQLLANDIENKTLRDAIREINNELKQGKDSEKVFLKQEAVFGKFTAHMLGLASKSGNMAEIYESTAKFLERQAQFKKDLKSALITPAVTMLALIGAVIYYIGWIFRPMAEIFAKFKIEMPPMTAATLKMSDFIIEHIIIISIVTLVPLILAVRFFTTPRGRQVLDRFIWKIPVIGTLLHKTNIEIFCRVFHALYSGSGENIDVIRMAAEACGNRYMENQIKNIAIPLMVEKGAGITEAFEASGVFTKTAISRFHSGAETGTVKNTAHQLAEYYEKETSYKMKNAIEYIQIWLAMVIMVILTALTIVSSETAMIRPKPPGAFINFLNSISMFF
ncbi:MAG: Type II secretory pathway, component PulF / Type IV fimbrial assembly protein PilC [Ignavibacteriae bacterium]|nr:MAG: Type II secretory pathway, component PulF / Type IV fimbrial assembly protein PilC [Ignavibacteriota bacterium]